MQVREATQTIGAKRGRDESADAESSPESKRQRSEMKALLEERNRAHAKAQAIRGLLTNSIAQVDRLSQEKKQAESERDQARAEQKQAEEARDKALQELVLARQELQAAKAREEQAKRETKAAVTRAETAEWDRIRLLVEKFDVAQDLAKHKQDLEQCKKTDPMLQFAFKKDPISYGSGSSRFHRQPSASESESNGAGFAPLNLLANPFP